MYTKSEVNTMLSQVEQEFEKALDSINKNEEIEVIEETQEDEVETAIAKSEEDEQGEEYETVDELYASMEKNEQEAHYNSLKRAIYGEVEEEQIAKSEETEEVEIEDLAKSENEQLKAENEELKKSYDEVSELLGKLFKKKAPAQKAITATSYIAKSEETQEDEVDYSTMSKSEITSKLNKVDFGSLQKSDRDAINNFYLNNTSVDKIKHLIKE